jgi:UDP-N-acetylmuramoylalanine--D-glutamate ligase
MNNKVQKYFDTLRNKKILIQGLGLNGGGVGTALFFLENGFDVTITDLKDENTLQRSIEMLLRYKDKITYVLGTHNESDFINADIVVKGPGVPPTNKYIQMAINNGALITSDIEIFYNIAPCSIFAVTGSKGKSTTTSCIYSIFKAKQENSFLGGNITISPLSFYRELNEESLVVLELSSWQLRDLKNSMINFKGAAITNLLNDHQNYYKGMDDYLDDKKIITKNQTKDDFLILPYSDEYLNLTNIKTKANVYFFSKDDSRADIFYDKTSGVIRLNDNTVELFNAESIKLPGEHIKINILIAASFCYLAGIDISSIQKGIASFNGVPYRMELVRTWHNIKFYNDTTATIPDASCNALMSFKEPIIWIAGGNDKNLDFSVITKVSRIPKKIFLLKGEGTDRMKKYLNRDDYIESDSLEYLFVEALKSASEGDIILLSPGCTSFGLFQNEFHRGDVFNKLVNDLK